MRKFTKSIALAGTLSFLGSSWYATSNGWGLPPLRDPATLRVSRQDNCEAWQKDRFGNCPPRVFRSSMGERDVYDGNGK